MGLRGLAPTLLLLLLGVAAAATAGAGGTDLRAACPGFYQDESVPAGSSARVDRYAFHAAIPEDLLGATPEQLTEVLSAAVEGLQLDTVVPYTNVSVGGYGQIVAVPLSTAWGGSFVDPSVQHPWAGQATLNLGYLTGPYFGMEQLAGFGYGARSWATPRSSFDEVMMPQPTAAALAAAQQFNADTAAAVAAGKLKAGPQDEMAVYQVMSCNSSELALEYHDIDPLPASLADESFSLQDLIWQQPALGPLFPEAQYAPLPLAMAPAQYTWRQYWPLLANGRIAGFISASIMYPFQTDALAGVNATSGYLKLMLNSPTYAGPSYGPPTDEATLRDVRQLMAAVAAALA